ncbi:MAG: transglutaminase-like cysteine peptidase [Spirochaetales bacterium]|jgi:predicted transglutaminase-like cysteine proteinase|nr:transglutaminase-like cysteine peptidase [Spirochaetales bacterium]
MRPISHCIFSAVITFFFTLCVPQQGLSQTLFNYVEMPQNNLWALQQWANTRTRHAKEDVPTQGSPIQTWFQMLNKTQHLSPQKQLIAINTFANRHPYILDIENYGLEDYWAIIKQFLQNNGDCEDYAITKVYSLRKLGFDNDQLRIVILQDTNLKVAHAVLAVFSTDDIVILDNQVTPILSHTDIKHYNPIYSINEKGWWLHLPPM